MRPKRNEFAPRRSKDIESSRRVTVSVPYELINGLFFGVPKAFTLREGGCKD
jgi:hypothetical protein